jgi:hypothetical protein
VQPIFRTLLVLGLLADVPVLRRALARFFLRPWLWLHTTPMSVFADLGRLGFLRCLQGNELILEEPFKVTAHWDEHKQACRLVSEACGAEDAVLAAGGLGEELRDALDRGRCRRLVWDHAALGDTVAFRFGRYRHLRMGVWHTGVASFTALRHLLRKTRTDRTAVVRQLLADGPCGLQSRRVLRLFVWAYLAPFVLANLLIGAVLAPCWRAAKAACSFVRHPFRRKTPAPVAERLPVPPVQYRKSA